MKILSIINISNEQDLTCDSGFIFQRIIASEFQKAGDTYILAGASCPSFQAIEETNFQKRYLTLGTNKYSSRFTFNFSEFESLISQEQPDIIFNTQVELTAAIKSVLEWNKKQIPLVSYCHYPALWNNIETKVPELDQSLNQGNLCIPILFDILSALTTSDAFVIQSHFARSLIEKAAKYYNFEMDKEIYIVPPPADPLLLSNKNIYLSNVDKNEKMFFYNHRLYKTYGTETFLDLFSDIYKRFNVPCIISDPMPNRSTARTKNNSTPVLFREKIKNNPTFLLYNGDIPRSTYKTNILKSIAAFAPLRKACVWSMASVDCMSVGVPVMAPKYASFPEFIPQELLYKTKDELFDLCENILTNRDFRLTVSEKSYKNSLNFCSYNVYIQLKNIFENVIERQHI